MTQSNSYNRILVGVEVKLPDDNFNDVIKECHTHFGVEAVDEQGTI